MCFDPLHLRHYPANVSRNQQDNSTGSQKRCMWTDWTSVFARISTRFLTLPMLYMWYIANEQRLLGERYIWNLRPMKHMPQSHSSYPNCLRFINSRNYAILCYRPIPHPEVSYRLWCVIVFDLETSRMRKLKPTVGCNASKRRRNYAMSWKCVVQWLNYREVNV
jgi:hypothetical protein